MRKERVRLVNNFKEEDGPIIYWMSRDQRIHDNWALMFAQEKAIKRRQPLIILFCLQQKFLNATQRIYNFMLDGLKKVERSLNKLNIPFIILKGAPEKIILDFIESFKISNIIIDFSPLRIKREWIKRIHDQIQIPIFEVDTHNIIPCWEVSNKKEYAAYTIRSKIQKKLNQYLDQFPDVKKHPYGWNESYEKIDWEKLKKYLEVSNNDVHDLRYNPGETEGSSILKQFLNEKLKLYNQNRNDPNLDGTSNLSPYLHFGHISAQRVILEARKIMNISNLKGGFYDEIIVRRELSDNFCYYEPNYDNVNGIHDWAIETLNFHRKDKREYIYSLEEFEKAKTHDKLWNAAQMQMVKTGKMHGYLRMYWCKKILEWTETPEIAMKMAIFLNNKYELDGRDPNGYVGIAWSIGGVHDRAWNERKVFGKIRYMSYNGMKRKFNITQYIEKYSI
ncbi:MAG: deoxyribodipyrimidine photo-lyase [Promethearchaeota archaeon]|nr:MAG: deoxyribodipyrimidine photo-lyase [Candidatus Lokiarchaeota archaeon]